MNRYDSYKPTGIEWIGEIPEHWEVKKLKYIAKVQPSNVDKKTEEGELPILLCNYMDVYKNEFIDASISFMEATANPIEIEKFRIKKGDLLVTKDSETPDDIANPALVVKSFENVICAYHLTQIRPDKDYLLGEYLLRLFQERRFKAQFEIGANGVTRFGLSVSKFSDAFIPLPPVKEQIKIANYISEKITQIDKLIASNELIYGESNRKSGLLKEYKTALISEVITGKIKVIDFDVVISIPSYQAVLAAEIMQQLSEEKTFGRVKFQKALYLCQHFAQLTQITSNYQRAAAGPLDEALLNSTEKELQVLQWFDMVSAPSTKYAERIIYKPLNRLDDYEKWYQKYWKEQDGHIQQVIGLLRHANTETCEMIATLFAAWNDLIIEGYLQPSPDQIVAEVYRWHPSKKRIDEKGWKRELEFMRKQNLIPIGFGQLTTPI